MRLKTFTIPIQHGEEAEEELNGFLGSHRILSIDKSFAEAGANSAWSICVTYAAGGKGRDRKPATIDYREVLSPPEFAVYARMRALRKTLAEEQSVPPYALFNNEHLARMVQGRMSSLEDLRTLGRIISSYETAPGKGLPIGALTSQHFANFYLSGLDRFLLESCKVGGMARYMDDILWWGPDRPTMRSVLAAARTYLRDHPKLEIKPAVQINSTAQGMLFCGFRVLPGRLLLSCRRKRRYIERRRHWEEAYLRDEVDALGLQAGYASALAITLHADATAWRREQLKRTGLAPGLEEV